MEIPPARNNDAEQTSPPDAIDFHLDHGAVVIEGGSGAAIHGAPPTRMRFEVIPGHGVALPPRPMSAAQQREALDGIASLIESHYVFTDVARVCAREVRGRPLVDEGLTTGEFCERLTAALRAHDRHFSVMWGAPTDLPLKSGAPSGGSSVTFHRDGCVGVIKIALFEDGDDADAVRRVRASLKMLSQCEVGVFDVRRNPGGWPSMVERVLGAVLGPEPVEIVTFKSAREPDVVSWSRPDPYLLRLATMPVLAVTGPGTASAAESFVYALQTTRRATLIGETTAGAANPVEAFLDRTGFSVYISTGAPIDPRTDANWDQVGVVPDLVVDTERALEVAIEKAKAACRQPAP